MITLENYFGDKEHTEEQTENAVALLFKVNSLLADAWCAGVFPGNDPDTGTQISGSKGGSGDGGFRLPNSTTGAPRSTHKLAKGVDVYDPFFRLAAFVTRKVLIKHDLYREHPDKTPGWCHFQDKPPGSGCRTYLP